MTEKQMIGRKVRYQVFVHMEGWGWAGEGEIIAETETAYKIKTGWILSRWVDKDLCEEIYF